MTAHVAERRPKHSTELARPSETDVRRLNTCQLLEQTQIWITADGMPIALAEMDPAHRHSTLDFLRRRPVYLRRAYDWCEVDELERGAVRFDMSAIPNIPSINDAAAAWLEHRPLIVELARLVELDSRGPVVPTQWASCDRWPPPSPRAA